MTPPTIDQETEFTTSIRPLTAEEYRNILESNDVELRASDGTREGTWRFWIANGELVYRQLSWTQNKACETSFMQNVLDEDVTTQLLAEDDD
jgi:hypothetical protein